MGGDKNEADSSGSERITLKVMGQGNNVLTVNIKKSSRLEKLMNLYCSSAGLDVDTVRFRFDGQPIMKSDTPSSFSMEENDIIEVYNMQIGGRGSYVRVISVSK